jgi:SAM-dependent methyltransferase
MAAVATKDPLFVESGPVATSLLDRAYAAQVRFFLPRELSVFRCCSQWSMANRVLDVGTGNGYFVQKLAQEFRAKRFVAIDIDDAQLALAEATNLSEEVSFRRVSVDDIDGVFDAVLLRFVAQHLPDLAAVLRHLRTLLSDSGTLYITESDNTRTLFQPEPGEFRRLFRQLAEQRRAVGADLDIVKRIPTIAWSAGFKVAEVRDVLSTSSDYGGLERMLDMELAILAYLKHVRVVEIDYVQAGLDLLRWSSSVDVYGEETLQVFKLNVA